MRTDPTSAEIARFREDGFVVIPDVLDGREVEGWRAAVAKAVERRLGAATFGNNQREGVDGYYKAIFVQAQRLADWHEGMRALVRDPGLGRLAATLAGVDAVRIWHDQALIKGPYGNQTSWHRDTPYWSISSRRTVNFWIALDDATLENGCLWYLPGTHRLAGYEHAPIKASMRDLFAAHPEWEEIPAVAAPCRAGSIVVHNGMVAHAAGPNMTPRPRRAMTIAYFPDGEVYNGQRDSLAAEYYDALRVGDPLDDERYVPVAWRSPAPVRGDERPV